MNGTAMEQPGLFLLRKGSAMINKALSIIFLTFILFSVPGCSEKAQDVAVQRFAPVEAKGLAGESAPEKPLFTDERKVIKDGEVYFESQDIDATRARIDMAVKKHGGYISNEYEYAYPDRVEQSVVARVPADNFDALIAEIAEGVKRFERKDIEATDVTEEYVDIEIRLKIKKETEDRYRQLLSRAKTVKDIVEIEKQLAEIREGIESVEGRLRYLQNRISLSTLTVTFYEKTSAPVGFSSKFKNGILNGWRNFVWSLVGLVNVWPFVILLAIAAVAIIKYRKLRKAGRGGPAEQAGDRAP
jgi:hypothetical protein